MVRWLRWHCPPDTGFEIRALAVWGRVRYLSVTEAPNNTNFHTWMGKKQFCVSFKPPRPGTEPRTLAWKAAVLTTTLGPPPTPYMSSMWFHQESRNAGPTLARRWSTVVSTLIECIFHCIVRNKYTWYRAYPDPIMYQCYRDGGPPSCIGPLQCINLLTAGPEYNLFFHFLLAHTIPAFEHNY